MENSEPCSTDIVQDTGFETDNTQAHLAVPLDALLSYFVRLYPFSCLLLLVIEGNMVFVSISSLCVGVKVSFPAVLGPVVSWLIKYCQQSYGL